MIHFSYMLETLKSSAVFCFGQFSYKTIQNKNYFTFTFIFTISGALYFHLVSFCCLKTLFCSIVIVILRLPWASISSTSSWYFFFPFVMSLILVVFSQCSYDSLAFSGPSLSLASFLVVDHHFLLRGVRLTVDKGILSSPHAASVSAESLHLGLGRADFSSYCSFHPIPKQPTWALHLW